MTSAPKLGIRSKSFWQDKAEAILLWLAIFLMPWQWRHTFLLADIGGEYFEYGSLHLYASDVAIILLLVVWLSRVIGKRIDIGPKLISWPLLAFLVWSSVSALWAVDTFVALATAAHLWLFFGFYLYLVNEVRDITRIFWPLLWSVVWQGLWGITQFVTNSSLGLNWLGESVLNPSQAGVPVMELDGVRQLRAHGMMPHANVFGGWLAAVLSVLLYWFSVSKHPIIKRMIIATLGLLAMAVALAFARGAWLVFGLVLIGIWLFWALGGLKKKLWAVAGVGLMFLLVLLTQYPYVVSRFDADNRLEQISAEERLAGVGMWQKIFGQYSIRGAGLGNYTQAIRLTEPEQPSWWYQPVHNIYLVISGELGIIGLAIWFWLVGAISVLISRIWRAGRSLVILSVPMGALLLLGLVDHWPATLQQGKILLFFALALIIIGNRLSLREHKT